MSIYETDLAIVGGGPAGTTAALAAADLGIKVLLIEKASLFGGMATGARVHSMLTFHGKKGEKIIGGIPDEIINRLKKAGGTTGHIPDTIGVAASVTPTDPDLLAQTLHVLLEEKGASYLLDSQITESVVKGGRIREVKGFNRAGQFSVKAKIFIDASGSGALSAYSGCSFESGRDGNLMPATLIFSLRGVDIDRIVSYMEENPDEFHHETDFRGLRKSPAIGVSGFFSHWREAGLSVPRDRLLFYQTLNKDEVGINSTRITNFDPLDPQNFNDALLKARKQVYEIFEFLKKDVPGFEKSLISVIAPRLGVREVRRIKGLYSLSGEDLALGKRFKDEVALGGFPIDIHSPTLSNIESDEVGGGGFYGIPYGSLVTRDVDNLFISGKCFSADFKAHASARVQATSMAMGQAVGSAAALCVKTGKGPKDVSVEKLREIITGKGGILEPEKGPDPLLDLS